MKISTAGVSGPSLASALPRRRTNGLSRHAVAVLKYGATAIFAGLVSPNIANAQRTAENAVLAAEDAFGTQIGLESTGIYTENDTRGFSPLKAGNYRLDGIYFDPVAIVSPRLKTSTAIRVGHAALDAPFPAPTGIVDTRMRTTSDEWTASPAVTLAAFGGWILEVDTQLPLAGKTFGVVLGYAGARNEFSDGAQNIAHGLQVKPVLRVGSVEISPFYGLGRSHATTPRPLTVINGDYVPPTPRTRRYLGQPWAEGRAKNDNAGVIVKASASGGLWLRSGLFMSRTERLRNYTELFSVTATASPARHRFIADPRQEVRSWSGEARLGWSLASGRWQHRIFGGFRFRNRRTDSGGSAFRDYGDVVFGERDPEVEETFAFNPVHRARVRQSAIMLGYFGRIKRVGQINLGLQKANYRATFRDAASGFTSTERDRPWLYNASAMAPVTSALSVFAGTQTGLEDSGAAPENAGNRNDQLPAARSRQYEAGLRWHFGQSHFVVSAFQISKPYFGFDRSAPGVLKPYVRLGGVRHRGIEASLAGHFGKRLHLLAGAVLMQPRVVNPVVDIGLIGKRPAGTPSLYARVDVNYRTDILGNLTPTASFTYSGRRAVGPPPIAGQAQLMLPPRAVLDIGWRQQFTIGRVPASIRAVLQNVFDEGGWKVIAANTLQMEDRRRTMLTLSADF